MNNKAIDEIRYCKRDHKKKKQQKQAIKVATARKARITSDYDR
jgi:hypothetical protein